MSKQSQCDLTASKPSRHHIKSCTSHQDVFHLCIKTWIYHFKMLHNLQLTINLIFEKLVHFKANYHLKRGGNEWWSLSITCQGLMKFGAPSYFCYFWMIYQKTQNLIAWNCVWAVHKDLYSREGRCCHVLWCGFAIFLLQNLCSEIPIHTGRYLSKSRCLSNETYVT